MKPSEIQHGGEPSAYFERYDLRPRPLLDFSVNLSPLGPPPEMLDALAAGVEDYPERYGAPLAQAYAKTYGIATQRILPLNGSIEGIYLWAQRFKPRFPLVLAPGFGDYEAALSPFAKELKVCSLYPPEFALDEVETHLSGCDACVFGSPHNPTGTAIDRETLRALVRRWPKVKFLVDQAFLGLCDDPEALSLFDLGEPNLWVLHSLTKEYACAGLRLGALILPQAEAYLWTQDLPPWRLSGPALAAAGALSDLGDYRTQLKRLLDQERREFRQYLAQHPRLAAAPSRANFFWVAYSGDLDDLLRGALEQGLFLRDGRSFGGAPYFRFGLQSAQKNLQLREFFDGLT